jgi:hypothetical protein
MSPNLAVRGSWLEITVGVLFIVIAKEPKKDETRCVQLIRLFGGRLGLQEDVWVANWGVSERLY